MSSRRLRNGTGSFRYEASLQSALDKAGFKAADGSTASTDLSQLQ